MKGKYLPYLLISPRSAAIPNSQWLSEIICVSKTFGYLTFTFWFGQFSRESPCATDHCFMYPKVTVILSHSHLKFRRTGNKLNLKRKEREREIWKVRT